jgi:AraC family transcriptional regulator of adaptative response/methylated-DNA-[protein]-cysteine methyltransferase
MNSVQKSIYRGIGEDYAKIEKAIVFLEQNYRDHPSLDELAARVNLSKFHFQRMFSRWAGISPKRFIQFLTLKYAKGLLENSQSVLDAALESGLSGPARLHDLFVAVESVTPGEFKSKGKGVTLRYGWHSSPFGEYLLALTSKGVCALSFAEPAGRAKTLEALRRKWLRAELIHSQRDTRAASEQIFSLGAGGSGGRGSGEKELGRNGATGQHFPSLHLNGTNFQINVWRALMTIPPGAAASYQDVARLIGNPGAARAVGRAVGENPIGFLIPCHRVIRRVGGFGGYRWGVARKKAMLGWEASRAAN